MRRDPQDTILDPPPREGPPSAVPIEPGDGGRGWKTAEAEEGAKREIASIPDRIIRVPPFDGDRR